MYLLSREGKTPSEYKRLYHNADGLLFTWHVEDNARDFADGLTSHQTWIVRRATAGDLKLAGKHPKNRTRKKPYIIKDEGDMAKKTTSTAMLVDVFEDYESRRFAVASKATTEQEFVTEFAQAIAKAPTSDWETRIRELLPLAVDMCCKYRGYKAETVQERRELVAGDLEMPKDSSLS